jgi:MFS family permease
MATSIVICGAVLSPMVGRLSDIFGRRNFLLLGNTLGIIGCANIATAKNINTVIGGGVLMGMASALHQLAWSCMGEVVPKKHRALALSLLQTSIAPASAFGPIIGNDSFYSLFSLLNRVY